MQSITWRIISLSAMFAGLALAGCSTVHHKSSSMDDGSAQADFPDPARATMPEGVFVNIENLRKVGPGMTKAQLYDLLGAPHFGEGVFGVRKWNYIFDFRKSNGEYFSCQYRIDFDRYSHATQFHWRPDSCRSVIEQPVAAAIVPAPLPREPIRLSSDALFAFDSADLTEQGRKKLSLLLQQVQSASQVENVLIAGYTDRIGSDGYNQLLSQRRAESVRNYLADAGVPLAAMRAKGRGEADPVVQCRQSSRDALIACLAPNRRVELSGAAWR